MSLTKEEFDERLDEALEDVKMWCWCDSEGCEGNRQRVNGKQALRQLILDVLGDDEVDYDHQGYTASRNNFRAELRKIIKGDE